MGWSLFALAIALVYTALGLVMIHNGRTHNGRKAEREGGSRGRTYDGE